MKTAEEWLQSEWRASRPMAEMVPDNWHRWFIKTIVAIQADALEAAALAANRYSEYPGGQAAEEAIRALIPTAPGTPRPGEPSKTPGHRT